LARYDIYANPDAVEKKFVPYYLDVQNDFLEAMDTRVVVPLWAPAALHRKLQRLNPELSVDGRKVVMDPAAIGAVPVADLRRPVGNIAAQQLDIQDALDALFGGY
jgi:toxin CcdB